MPITSDQGGKNYVLGRGRVYFDRYPAGVDINAATAGEGERYFGNSPEFSTSSSADNLDHFSSEGGIKVKDDSVQLSLNRTGKFTSDNISADNIALYFLGDAAVLSQASAATIVYTVTAKQDRWYQLGLSPTLPLGHRQVTVASVKSGVAFGTTVPATAGNQINYEVDEATGRIYIPVDSAIVDDTPIQVTYAVAAVTYDTVISSSNAIYGAIRFVSDNPKGADRDYYLPYVKLAPDGDYALKGDDWQTMSFTMEILTKAENIAALYISGRPQV